MQQDIINFLQLLAFSSMMILVFVMLCYIFVF